MKIKYARADYTPFYGEEMDNNDGDYWQYYGTCTVKLDDGTILYASYENTSCGDFGERWCLEFVAEDGERFILYEDKPDNDEWNVKTADRIFTRFGVYSSTLIYHVSYAISLAALDKYLADSADE